MPFPLNYPGLNAQTQELQLEPGQMLFVLGSNGTGKSSLMYCFSNQNMGHARKISAHRQTWLNSDALDLTPSTKLQTERNIQDEDRQQTSRYQDVHAAERPRVTIYDLVDAENVRARAMAAAYDACDITSVPHFQDHASDNWEPEGAGSDGVVNRSWSGRRSNMLSWSTCSIW